MPRDSYHLFNEWRRGDGAKVENTAIHRVLDATDAISADSQVRIVEAICEAMEDAWDAAWVAAGGNNEV